MHHPKGSARGRWRLVIGLFLACLAFWIGADFLHADEGPEYVRDCPVCHLERVTSCETPAVAVAQTCSLLVLVCRLDVPRVFEGSGANHSFAARPRGPPAVA